MNLVVKFALLFAVTIAAIAMIPRLPHEWLPSITPGLIVCSVIFSTVFTVARPNTWHTWQKALALAATVAVIVSLWTMPREWAAIIALVVAAVGMLVTMSPSTIHQAYRTLKTFFLLAQRTGTLRSSARRFPARASKTLPTYPQSTRCAPSSESAAKLKPGSVPA
jgi:hypothetical protein